MAVAALIGFGIWLAVRDDGGSKATSTTHPKTVAAVSEQGLKKIADVLNHPIYWAGPQSGVTYEMTQTSDGRFFIRYLGAGEKVGTTKQFPFIATFPIKNAFAVTRTVAARSGSVQVSVGGGAVAFYPSSSPTNVYLAYPGSDYQIEVFDPNSAEAQRWVTQGRIVPVSPNAPGASTGKTVTGASVTSLKQLASQLGHSLYWAGPMAGSKLELTRTGDGRIFVRYIPITEAIGTSKPYLFVATFPVSNAFSATQGSAAKPGSVKLTVPGGAVAFYDSSSPSNVYLAFPGSDYQIEVYAPDAKQGWDLVKSGRIVAVS